MFRTRLFEKVEQAIKWKTIKGRQFVDEYYYHRKRAMGFQVANIIQITEAQAMCTCQGTWDSVDMDILRKGHKDYERCSRDVLQDGQHDKGTSRGALKVNIQKHDEAEELAQSKEDELDQKNAVFDEIEELSDCQTKDVEHEYNRPEDESDMDLENDDASVISPDDIFRGLRKQSVDKLPETEKKKAIKKMMNQMVSDALDVKDAEEGEVPECEQHSLRVGIIGAVNAGKSTLTNLMVGTKVAAVSRKRNTTLSEILGIVTNGKTQILLYDTPGLVLDILGTPSKTDTRRRSESAWQLFSHCEVLLVLVDAYRQIHKPDKRVLRLVERLGAEETFHLKKCLVLNKVDIIENKRLLLPLAQQFGNLPGYENIFMVSALTGSGVRDVASYLMDQAVLRPWEEEPGPLNEETIRTLSMEIVREHLLDRVHEEIPYELDQQLVDWQELEDGSLRVEQHFYLPKKGQCRIVVGKGGSKIREIGIKACEELRKLLNKKVHLFLQVKHS